MTQFPRLKELINWNTNQTGAFVCHSSVIQMIDSYENNYIGADIRGCTNLESFNLSGNQLTSLNLGTAHYLTNVQLKDCGLTESLVNYVLKTLDRAGRSNGYLDLSMNTAPSAEGLVHLEKLKGRGWIVEGPEANIIVTGEGGATTITTDKGTLQLIATLLPSDSTDKTVTWSVLNGTGQATISDSGLLTAIDNGTVTAVAKACDASGDYGTIIVTISHQIISLEDFPYIIGKIIVTSNEIKVLLNDCFISWKASLYNLQGILLISQIAETNALIFDISKFPSGYYIVVLSRGVNIRVAHVIKP